MARLRKVSPSDPAIVLPAKIPATSRTTRSLREESPSKRELRYTSSQEPEESFLVPKAPASETPNRRQRTLKPVALNSTLLSKCSIDDLTTPEKPLRKRRDDGLGFLYSRSLAKTAIKRREQRGLGDKKIDVAVDTTLVTEVEGSTKVEQTSVTTAPQTEGEVVYPNLQVTQEEDISEKHVPVKSEVAVDENEEPDESLMCDSGEETEDKPANELDEVSAGETQPVEQDDDSGDEIEETEPDEQGQDVSDEFEDSDDSIVAVKNRRRQLLERKKHSMQTQELPFRQPQKLPTKPSWTQEEEDESSASSASESSSSEEDSIRNPRTRHHNLTTKKPTLQKPQALPTKPTWTPEIIDLTSSPPPRLAEKPPPALSRPEPAPRRASNSRPTSSDSNNNNIALLTYSPPPKIRSPRKAPPISRPSTPPPAPPNPTKLISPSKKKPRIPTPPHNRPSLEAFWAPEVVNDWNDTYSPAKPLLSPRKQKLLASLTDAIGDSSNEDSDNSPTTSPRRKPTQTPRKPSPTVATNRAARKAFTATKHSLAAEFLTLLDTTITSGEITRLTSSTGGIKLIWSRTLNTTAGRANWRRETLRLRTGLGPTDLRTEHRHHASIELAEKVIDDASRLYNVLAHEYCHLTTFMISNQRSAPHGAEFKSWAARVSTAFAHDPYNVTVTTKHSYKIDYKYIWECETCGYEFKRHSKSVDVQRHSCGRCKGRLVQTKPAPRVAKDGRVGEDGKPQKSEYQMFVKENFGRVKKELESRGQGEKVGLGRVMEVLGREYREGKGRREGKKEDKSVDTGDVEAAFEGLGLEDKDV